MIAVTGVVCGAIGPGRGIAPPGAGNTGNDASYTELHHEPDAALLLLAPVATTSLWAKQFNTPRAVMSGSDHAGRARTPWESPPTEPFATSIGVRPCAHRRSAGATRARDISSFDPRQMIENEEFPGWGGPRYYEPASDHPRKWRPRPGPQVRLSSHARERSGGRTQGHS